MPAPDHSLKPLSVESVRMVAIDLDGTLLRSDGSISPASIAAVKQARAKGIHVVLATARPPRGAIKAWQQLGLDTLMVCHNGALIYDPRSTRVVDHQPLDGAVARAVVEVARRVGGTRRLGIDIIDTMYSDKADNSAGSTIANVTGTPSPAPLPFEHMLARPVTKVFVTGDPGRLAEIQFAVHQAMQGQVTFATSHLQLLQVVRAGVDKSVALAKVATLLGVTRQGVMAIGDAPNDLGMFKWAGLSIAMKNGWRDALKAAHFVVASNDDDGVAQAIERYALL